MKDYELPAKIYHFVREVQAGFSLVRAIHVPYRSSLTDAHAQLNLKNDPLRRRFDS